MEPFDLNIRHLRAVVAVVESGSISAAAPLVNLTQPALSQGLAKLEQQIGLGLFERQPKGMVPTEAGVILARRSLAALRLLNIRHVTSAQMHAFLAVARAGGYAPASVATGLAEPSLHRAVADLAVSVGQPLVMRRGRGIGLTAKGAALAKAFGLAEAELRSGLEELAQLSGREVGRIIVGAMPLSRARVLPAAVADFHAAHPHMGIRIIESSHAELIGPLKGGEIDLMLGALRPDLVDPEVVQTPLFIDRPVIFGRRGHPLKAKRDLEASDLLAFPWVVAAEGTPLHHQWRAMFAALGVAPPPIQVECGSVMMVRQILKDSDVLTLLSPDQLAVEMEANWVEILSEAPGDLSRTIGITTRADWRPTALQGRFLDSLRTVSADLTRSC